MKTVCFLSFESIEVVADRQGRLYGVFCVIGDGKCCICDSYVRPHVLVHICDDCNYGSFEVRKRVCFCLLFEGGFCVFVGDCRAVA